MKRIEIIGVEGMGEIRPGDCVGELICAACARQGTELADGDVLVVAQKIVSKAEGRLVNLHEVQPSAQARELGRELDKDPALVEVILGESRRIVRKGARALIVETHHGFVSANGGVDCSNVGMGQATLLPKDADASAQTIRAEIHQSWGGGPPAG